MQLDDLNAIAEKHKSSRKKICLRSCMSAGCMSSQADVTKKNLEAEVKAQGLEADVEVRRVGCMGFCGQGPLVGVDQNGSHGLWEFVKPEDAPAIVGALKGNPCNVQRGDPITRFSPSKCTSCARTAASLTRNASRITSPSAVTRHCTTHSRKWSRRKWSRK